MGSEMCIRDRSWEETILYNEYFSYFLQREQNSPPVIIFFEVGYQIAFLKLRLLILFSENRLYNIQLFCESLINDQESKTFSKCLMNKINYFVKRSNYIMVK